MPQATPYAAAFDVSRQLFIGTHALFVAEHSTNSALVSTMVGTVYTWTRHVRDAYLTGTHTIHPFINCGIGCTGGTLNGEQIGVLESYMLFAYHLCRKHAVVLTCTAPTSDVPVLNGECWWRSTCARAHTHTLQIC